MFVIAPEALYERSWTDAMLFFHGLLSVFVPKYQLPQKKKKKKKSFVYSTLSTHCVLSEDQVFFLWKLILVKVIYLYSAKLIVLKFQLSYATLHLNPPLSEFTHAYS